MGCSGGGGGGGEHRQACCEAIESEARGALAMCSHSGAIFFFFGKNSKHHVFQP